MHAPPFSTTYRMSFHCSHVLYRRIGILAVPNRSYAVHPTFFLAQRVGQLDGFLERLQRQLDICFLKSHHAFEKQDECLPQTDIDPVPLIQECFRLMNPRIVKQCQGLVDLINVVVKHSLVAFPVLFVCRQS